MAGWPGVRFDPEPLRLPTADRRSTIVAIVQRRTGFVDLERLARQLGQGVSLLAPLLPEVRAALPATPPPALLGPDEARFRLFDAVTQFLLAAARDQPVLVVLDDLHWADRDSLQLLRHLARFVGKARLLVVGAYRDADVGLGRAHPLMDVLGSLRHEVDYERLSLRGLSNAEVAEYLVEAAGRVLHAGGPSARADSSRVGGSPSADLKLSPALVQAIYRETGGNPFYTRELFRHLVDEGKIFERDGGWAANFTTREPFRFGVPEGVRQVLHRRLARLSDGTNTLLRLASACSGGSTLESFRRCPRCLRKHCSTASTKRSPRD